jgi:TIR domain
VWYDEFELRIGDSLRRKIDTGISRSRFGVVVLSRAFFAKNWPQYELDGLVTREMAGERQIILPLWHEISKDEVMRHSPSLADKVALQTAVYSVQEIADQIVDVILPHAA